jgi:hypothetical protein
MRKACVLLLLLLLAAPPGRAQGGADPELMPGFQPARKKSARTTPRPRPRPVPVEDTGERGYDILPARKAEAPLYDLNRKPVPVSLNAKPEQREFVLLRARWWDIRGSVDTRVSERGPAGAFSPASVDVGETQENGFNGAMLLASAELAPFSWLSLVGEYGRDQKLHGAFHDRFWVHSTDGGTVTNTGNGATWDSPNHEDDEVLSAAAHGKTEWAAATLYLRAIEARIAGQDDDSFRHSFDIGVGAQRLRVTQRLTDLRNEPSAGKYYTPGAPGPVPGLDATYAAQWLGGHVALRETVRFPARFAFEGEALWSPVGMQYRGEGYDNLNAGPGALRVQSPNFTDRANGSAVHFRFSGKWGWGPFGIEGGYQRLYFYSRTGRRTYHNQDGTDTAKQLDFAATEMGGLFAGASLRF